MPRKFLCLKWIQKNNFLNSAEFTAVIRRYKMFENIVVAGIPLLAVVLGLVQFIKGFNLSGNIVKVLSLTIGLVLGFGYQLSLGALVGFHAYFSATIFGLGLGLVASGLYDANRLGK
jgi:hypothetical protein